MTAIDCEERTLSQCDSSSAGGSTRLKGGFTSTVGDLSDNPAK